MPVLERIGSPARKVGNSVSGGLEEIGKQLAFYGSVLGELLFNWRMKVKYRGVLFNLVSDITIGAGALIVGGGMVFVIFSMSFFTGTEVGLQGFKGLEQIGAEAFTGLVGSFANTREVTPLIAGVAFAAQVGAGFTAELGAMRISDEIDALEVMSVPSPPVPGGHPGRRRPRRHHPALPDLAVRQLLRHQARDAPSSSACRRASTTTTSASTCRRSTSSTAWPRRACSPSSWP